MRSAPTTTACTSPAREKVASHSVGDDLDGDSVARELPRGQPRALQIRARLSRQHANRLARLDRAANDAERRPVPRRGEAPRVAVRQERDLAREERGPELADPAASGDVLRGDPIGFVHELALDALGSLFAAGLEAPRHPVECREEVHRRRTRRGEQAPSGLEALGRRRRASASLRERGAVRGGDPDGRGSADRHLADRQSDLRRRLELEPDLLGGKTPLVEKAKASSLAVERAEDLGHAVTGRE
jgi:hypothetical protein